MSHSTYLENDWRLQADFNPEIRGAKQIFTQKFESPGLQIAHKINWKVDTSSRGIQLKIHLKPKF